MNNQHMHEGISKIVGISKKHLQQPPPPPLPPPPPPPFKARVGTVGVAGEGATAAGSEIERAYLHQCVAQVQPLPDDSKGDSPVKWTDELYTTARSTFMRTSSSSTPSSSASSSRQPSPAKAAHPNDSVFQASLRGNPYLHPAVVKQMLARLETNKTMTHMVDGGDSDVSEGSERSSHEDEEEETHDSAIFEALLANNPPPDTDVVPEVQLDTGYIMEHNHDNNAREWAEETENEVEKQAVQEEHEKKKKEQEEQEGSGDGTGDEMDDADDEMEEDQDKKERMQSQFTMQTDVAPILPVIQAERRSPASTPLPVTEGPGFPHPSVSGLEEGQVDAEASPASSPEPVIIVVDPASDALNAALTSLEEEEPEEGCQRQMQIEAGVNDDDDQCENIMMTTAGLKEGEEEDRALLDVSMRAIAWCATTTTRTELCMHLDSDGEEDRGNVEHHQDQNDEGNESEDEYARIFTQRDKEREYLSAGQGKGYEAAARQVPLPLSPPPPSAPPLQRPNLGVNVEEEVPEDPIVPLLSSRTPTYEPPLTVMARVRSFLAPPPNSSSSFLPPSYPQSSTVWQSKSSQQQSRQQQQQQERQHEDQPHLSVVNKHRLVLVNPEALEDADSGAIVGMVSGMKNVAVDGDIDGQVCAQVFELDRAYWSVDPRDAHFVSQAALYADLGAAMEHEAFVQGIDVTCFAYGASKSGKTYTLFGPDQALLQDPTLQTNSDLGLIPRILGGALAKHVVNTHNIILSLSALEISALDTLQDLLQDHGFPAPGSLRICEHPVHGPFVEHLTITEIPTNDKLQQVLKAVVAARRRTGAAGHVLMTVYITRVSMSGAVVGKTRMHFVELAGVPPTCDFTTTPSSPSKSTSSSYSFHSSSSPRRRYNSSITIGSKNGVRSINTVQPSLNALGTILKQLGEGKDISSSSRCSALTWLTEGALTNPEGGHAYLLLCLSPASGDYHETLRTLNFGEPLRLRQGVNRWSSLQASISKAGGTDPGTPVRDVDVRHWSMVHEDFDRLIWRVSGGLKANVHHTDAQIDPQQCLVKQQGMCATTASTAEAAQHPLGSDDEDRDEHEDEDEGRDSLYDSFIDNALAFSSAPQVSAELEEINLSLSGGRPHNRSFRDKPLLQTSSSVILSTSSSQTSGGTHQSCYVEALKARAMELEIQLQSMRKDRDMALAKSQTAQEELQRFKSQELTTKSKKIHELDNALTALRHEYQELERAIRKYDNERIYLGQLLDETKTSYTERLQHLEAQVQRLELEKKEWESQTYFGGSHGSYDQLQQQLMATEQRGQQLAQELQEAAKHLDKVKLDASDTARRNVSLREEVNTLRSKMLQQQQQQQQSAAANVEALHKQHQQQRFQLVEQLRAKDAAIFEQRREGSRVAQSLHDRVLTLEQLAAHADGWALRDGLRVETAALGVDLRRWMEKIDWRGTSNSGFPSPYDTPYSSLSSFSRHDHHHTAFTPAFSSPQPPVPPVAAATVVEGRLSGMNECLRQENIELKEKLRGFESRNATKDLVETVLSGITHQQHQHQQHQQHSGSSSKAQSATECDIDIDSNEEESIYSVQHCHGSRGGGSGSRHRTEYYYCDQGDELEEDELSESNDFNHQLEVEAELSCARQEALRLQQQNRALLGELEDLDKLLVEAESEGISLISNGKNSKLQPRYPSPPRREPKASSSRHISAAATAVNIETMGKDEVVKASTGIAVNAGASARRLPAAGASTNKRSQQDKSTKQFLKLLEKKRRQQQQAATTPLTSTPAAKPVSPSLRGGFSAPRERETRKGQTEWVRENKVTEDWIGSLRNLGANRQHMK